MVVCPNCGKDNPPDAKFCNQCSKEFVVRQGSITCMKCGSQNAAEMLYCGKCGAALNAAPAEKAALIAKTEAPAPKPSTSNLPKRYCRHCGAEVGIWDTECPKCHKDPSYSQPVFSSVPDYDQMNYAEGPSDSLTPALIIGAILAIIAGLMALGQGIIYASVSSLASAYVPTGYLCLCGGVDILFGLASLAAGVFSLRRSNFGLAVVGAALGMLGLGFFFGALFGLVALILIAISKDQFD